MMGRQTGDQSQLFYLFNLEERIAARHLLRRINPIVTRVLADLRETLGPFYSEIGRPSIDLEMMRLCSSCSMTWALQPVMREATKNGVYSATSSPNAWYSRPAGQSRLGNR